jgi:hypothetical protein
MSIINSYNGLPACLIFTLPKNRADFSHNFKYFIRLVQAIEVFLLNFKIINRAFSYTIGVVTTICYRVIMRNDHKNVL